jgi:hypothetical protein
VRVAGEYYSIVVASLHGTTEVFSDGGDVEHVPITLFMENMSGRAKRKVRVSRRQNRL